MMVLACRRMAGPDVIPGQLGLIGMRERVMSMAGSLTIRHGDGGHGLTIIVEFPRVNSRQSRNLDDPE